MEYEKLVLAALSGEIVLKSERTRPRFEQRLVENIHDALSRNNVSCKSIAIEYARLLVRDCSDYDKALDTLLRVFGVHGAAIAYSFKHSGSLDEIAVGVREIAAEWVKGRKFAVRARRSGVEGFTSLDIARRVGAELYPYSAGVDLEKPEVEVYVEVRGRQVYVYQGMRPGPGGLPVGVEGRALVLFSGGLDSPVAAWYTAKRGVEVDLLHFILAVPASARDAERVGRRLAELWLYGYKPKLFLVDFRPVTVTIASNTRRGYEQIVLRLAMYYAAQLIAEKHGYDAVVTGESIGQVSSQTLKNMKAMAQALPLRLPLIRPLAGMDKEEIVTVCRRIGVYEEAAKTKEYCQIARGLAITRADPKILSEEFEKVKDIVEASLATLKTVDLA
ncbi:tRNA uracil 4-sulfurtransferase ThiI [Hyperthermus butylicus]|uniref:Probable tRNA sulfurtransferase n=1 Tax=Hyperthermus butylicus (strain DSM 5456 / JCM 9403 / PLM1-5) TaxID=415426 RepID=A2BKB5_HYPBU|nr:tRNA uracil 4-sulfurtransferase ThiI [Hyperthermus butylicus]ABM80426.1 putative thiamine biosynthesis protein, ThiI [Hyperthermus butylicus DSM 5456]